MPRKTDAELRALWTLFAKGAAYEDYPDGATWADLEDAQKLLAAKEPPDAL